MRGGFARLHVPDIFGILADRPIRAKLAHRCSRPDGRLCPLMRVIDKGLVSCPLGFEIYKVFKGRGGGELSYRRQSRVQSSSNRRRR